MGYWLEAYINEGTEGNEKNLLKILTRIWDIEFPFESSLNLPMIAGYPSTMIYISRAPILARIHRRSYILTISGRLGFHFVSAAKSREHPLQYDPTGESYSPSPKANPATLKMVFVRPSVVIESEHLVVQA